MPARFGLGPVFAFEWLIASRRWQMYAIRGIVVFILLAALVIVWEVTLHNRIDLRRPLSYKDYGEVGESFFYTVVGTQLALLLLAAPGAAAGSVCLDKMRGTLLHVLVTDLSAAEVVLGKLASRLIPVLGLIACSVPVLMICTLLGGLDIYAVAAAYTVMVGVGVFGTALALLLSVWGRKPHEVLLVVYLIEVLWLLAYPIALAIDAVIFQSGSTHYWLRDLNPYALAFDPYTRPGLVDWDQYSLFLLVTFGAAAVCTLLAIASVRRVAVRHDAVTGRPKAPGRLARRRVPALDGNPLHWYERHRKRPSRWTRAVWRVYGLLTIGGAGVAVYEWLSTGGSRPLQGPLFLNALMPAIGLLLAVVGAVTALADERVRGNLDVLLATPLRTSAIVWAKWRAAFRPIPWLLLLPAFLCGLGALSPYQVPIPGWLPNTSVLAWIESWEFTALLVGLLLANGAFLTSLGLALATWVPRVGRAIAYGVGLYVLQCLVWPFVAMGLFVEADQGVQAGAALLSPIYGSGVLTQMIVYAYRPPGHVETLFWWGAIWFVFLIAAAGLLYWLTLATFDRCLGRVPEGGMRRRQPRTLAERPRSAGDAVESLRS